MHNSHEKLMNTRTCRTMMKINVFLAFCHLFLCTHCLDGIRFVRRSNAILLSAPSFALLHNFSYVSVFTLCLSSPYCCRFTASSLHYYYCITFCRCCCCCSRSLWNRTKVSNRSTPTTSLTESSRRRRRHHMKDSVIRLPAFHTVIQRRAHLCNFSLLCVGRAAHKTE